MADYFVKNGGNDAAAGTSDGAALATVYAALTSGTIAATGNTIYLRCGDVFDERVGLSSITVAGSGWTLDCYGDGPLPIITRASRNPTWSSATGGTWSYALAGNGGGLVSEDGYPLRWVEWDTNIATTAAVMRAGDYTFDPVGFVYYIKPRSGTPSNHTYVASNGAYGFNATSRTDWTVQNVRFEYCSGFGIYCPDNQRYTIQDSEFRFIGGWYGVGANSPQGDAIAPFDTVIDAVIRRNLFEEIFDAACYPQAFNNSKTIRNVTIEHNVVRRCGLFGFGASILGSAVSGCSATDVRIRYNDISGMGEGWAEDRGAQCINFSNTSTQSTSNAAGLIASHNKIRGGNISLNNGGTSCAFVGNDCRDALQAGMRTVGTASKEGITRSSGNLYVGSGTRGIWVDATNATGIVTNDTVAGSWGEGARSSANTGSGLSIKNSIIQGATVGINQSGSVAATADYNCIHNCGTQETGLTSTNTMTDDPLLDASYRPREGSPLIGAATYIPGARHMGGKRMSVINPTIGAYNYEAPRSVALTRAVA